MSDARRIANNAADVLAAWIAFLALENLVVGVVYRELLVASWEMSAARRFATPIAIASLVPCALVAAIAADFAKKPSWRRELIACVCIAGAALGYGVTNGRHFSSVVVRVPFVLLVAAACGLAARVAVPRFVAMPARARATWGAALAAGAWAADAFVLPRLYPAFHAALLVIALAAAALVSSVWRGEGTARITRAARWLPRVAAFVGVASIAWTPHAARVLAAYDNLRLVLVDHAPVLGPAVRVAAEIASPEPPDDTPASPTLTDGSLGEIPRALDWSGKDIVLLTVDALRADHVSSYGYSRATTPNIDALAKEGARFEHAYCPTPHTSYSITSMMTGKYMRPLLALDLGQDSETWASYLRRYGYRTAAFYPPAVFYIDADRFARMQSRALDFEYAKIEFATTGVREAQIDAYLTQLPREKKLFLWLHLFEPHEPYVAHAGHTFGDPSSPRDVDAYDSEIAEADAAIGAVVARMDALRPGAVVIVAADHGEEFGEHGGRYHGTTVYEEQVRVPLVVRGPGVAREVVDAPVQTIDLLPTVLSALGIPRPPRIRGRDLGPALAREARGGEPKSETYAFAETDDFTMIASAHDRLVCRRSIDACALYDVASDPGERTDRAATAPERVHALKTLVRDIERAHGRYERGARAELPEALRRGLQGDADAAEDAAALLDDADVRIRRVAAEVCYRVHTAPILPSIRRAFSRDEDDEVKRWTALALLRAGDATPSMADALLHDSDASWRARAALAFAERGDARGTSELVARWTAGGLEFREARELLAAFARVRAKTSVPVLARSLDDVRLRPYIAETLGAIGAPEARAPLARAFAHERYASARTSEARALSTLGDAEDLAAPLARFAGVPDPAPDLAAIARDAGLVVPARGGVERMGRAVVDVPGGEALRAYAFVRDADAESPSATIAGTLTTFAGEGAIRVAEIAPSVDGHIALELADGVDAVWIVARARELPPPAPESWDAGEPEPRENDQSAGGNDR